MTADQPPGICTDPKWKKYLADYGQLVASGKKRIDEALGAINRALADAGVSEEEQAWATMRFLWYAEGEAPPPDLLQNVWDIVTRNLSRLSPPEWCARPYAPLYLAAWILGVNGRTFEFACPAFADLAGMKRGSILNFRRIACRVDFMREVEAGKQGYAATLFMLGDNLNGKGGKPPLKERDWLNISREISAHCHWLIKDHFDK